MRYAWDQFDAYFGPQRVGRRGQRGAAAGDGRLARWDRATAGPRQPLSRDFSVCCAAGSRGTIIARRRSSTRRSTPSSSRPAAAARRGDFLVVSALVPYKRIDVGHRRRHARRRAARHRRRRARTRAASRRWRPARPACGCSAGSTTTRCATATARAARGAAAGRRGLRHRAGRGPGLRPAGGGARPRRRDRNGRSTARPACSCPTTPSTPWAAALRRAAAARPGTAGRIRANAERFGRDAVPRRVPSRGRRGAGRASRHPMVRRYNRLLVALHVADRRLDRRRRVRARLPHPLRDRALRRHQGPAAARAVPRRAAVRGRPRAARLPPAGPLPAAPRPLARRRLLRRPRRQHLRRGPRRGRHAVRPGLLRARRPEEPRRLRDVAAGLGALPGLHDRARLPALARGRARDRSSGAGVPASA